MSWMIHFSGKDFGPITDELHTRIVSDLETIANGGTGRSHAVIELDSPDSTGPDCELFWTPGAPIAFTRIR